MLLDVALRGQRLLALDRTEIWMLIFVCIVLASALFLARRPLYGLRVAVDAFLIPFLAYFPLRRWMANKKRFQQLLRMLGYTGVYLICIAIVERLDHTYFLHRLHGPFETRDHLYTVLMTIFFMVFLDHNAVGDEPRKALSRGSRWFILGLAPVIIFATWTRGNWLGFLMGIWALLFLRRRFVPMSRKLIRLGLVLLIIPLLVISFPALTPRELDDRIGREHSIYARLGAWLIQVQEIAAHPLLGIGLNNLRDVLATKRVYIGGVKSETHSHNSYLAFCAELGVLGLFAYRGMMLSLLRTGLRLYRRQTAPQAQWHGMGLVAILVAYLIPPLTSSILYAPMVTHVYVFACFGAMAGLHRHHLVAPRHTVVQPSRTPSGELLAAP